MLSISALAFVTLYAVGLAAALTKRPIVGLIVYLFVFYNHPPTRWWGAELPELRWSLIAAVATLIAIQFHRSKGPSQAADRGEPGDRSYAQ